MTQLSWGLNTGSARSNGAPWVLRSKPKFKFEFDDFNYCDGHGCKTFANSITNLTEEEIAELEAWLAAQDPSSNDTNTVHGADKDGVYLGLINRKDAVYTLLSAPPATTGWLWNESIKQWQRNYTLAELQAQAITDIDAAADGIYSAVIGSRGEEYQAAKQQAEAFAAALYLGTAPASVANWAQVKKQSTKWAADNILATSAQWQGAMQAIRGARLGSKEAVKGATNAAQVAGITAAYRAGLNQIRQALGLPAA